MSAVFSMNGEDHDTHTRATKRPGFAVRWVRPLGLVALVASAGLLLGVGVLAATNVLSLIPQDGPQIWVKSGCGYAEAAVRAAQHATPDDPVFIIPLDQDSEMTQSTCRSTLAALDHEGYFWLQYFPERWVCQRFADEASVHHAEPIPVPLFYADGKLICDGLCDEVFVRIGHPELQQYVTFFGSSKSL